MLSGNRQPVCGVQTRAREEEAREVSDGINVDLDADGGVVGFDIDHASKRLDLSTLETEALSLRSTKAG